MATNDASNSNQDAEKLNGMEPEKYKTVRPQTQERAKIAALEVSVDNSVERAMKVLKRKLIKEGLFKELKARRYYEKPSQKRKRKLKESLKKIRKEEARRRKNQNVY